MDKIAVEPLVTVAGASASSILYEMIEEHVIPEGWNTELTVLLVSLGYLALRSDSQKGMVGALINGVAIGGAVQAIDEMNLGQGHGELAMPITKADSTIAFELRDAAATGEPIATKQTGTEPESSSSPQRTAPETDATKPDDETDVDPAARVSRLPSANRPVVSVTPDNTLATAMTEMLKHNYSQLPVIISGRHVKGMVSWESIGKRLSLGVSIEYVRECMEPTEVVDAESLLFEAFDTIIQNKAVLVRGGDENRIVGILTTEDLSRECQKLVEPFLRIEEIEKHLRDLLRVLPLEEIAGAVDPNYPKDVESASDLALGEILRLIERPDVWDRLELPLDRVALRDALERVGTVRNAVMHFAPEDLDEEDLELLRRVAKMFHDLRTMGVLAAPSG